MKRHKHFNFQFSIFNLAAALLLLFAACDTIDSEEYTVYDGAPVSWSAAPAAPEAVQRAYVEKYTGPHCNNCPKADRTLDALHHQHGDRLVVVSINHPTGQGIPFRGDPDMRTDGGTAWDRFFGINAIPAAYLNRNRSNPPYLGEMGSIGGDIAAALQQTPTAAIAVQASAQGSSVNITADIALLQEFPSSLTLTAALIEDSLVYNQSDGTTTDTAYVHNHMLRKVITSYWGRDLPAGQNLLRGTLSFTPADDIVLENSHIVVFLSDKASRRVINCASCPLTTDH